MILRVGNVRRRCGMPLAHSGNRLRFAEILFDLRLAASTAEEADVAVRTDENERGGFDAVCFPGVIVDSGKVVVA